MKALAYFIPAEKHYGYEGGLHEKGKNSFNGQGSPEYITYKPRVVGPVGSELKFKDNSGGYPDGKINPEKFHPKFCDPLPLLISGANVNGVHKGHNE